MKINPHIATTWQEIKLWWQKIEIKKNFAKMRKEIAKWYETSSLKNWIAEQKQKIKDWFKKDKKEEEINKNSSKFFIYLKRFLLFICLPIVVLFFLTFDYATIDVNPIHWSFFTKVPFWIWIVFVLIILFLLLGPYFFKKIEKFKIKNGKIKYGLFILLGITLIGLYTHLINHHVVIYDVGVEAEELSDKINIKRSITTAVEKYVLPEPNVPIPSPSINPPGEVLYFSFTKDSTGNITGDSLEFGKKYELKAGDTSLPFRMDPEYKYDFIRSHNDQEMTVFNVLEYEKYRIHYKGHRPLRDKEIDLPHGIYLIEAENDCTVTVQRYIKKEAL